MKREGNKVSPLRAVESVVTLHALVSAQGALERSTLEIKGQKRFGLKTTEIIWEYYEKVLIRGPWVAQSVQCLPSAQVITLGSWD